MNTKDKFVMDGHKLHWHLDRVNDWLNGKRIFPLHIDVGLSKGCNIRCEYCFGMLQGNLYKKKGSDVYFPREALLRYIREAGYSGVRSMAFIGEAEPTMNPNLYDAIIEGKKAGVDISLGTNGILFDSGKSGEAALEHLSWIRFNISAGSEAGYKKIHRSKAFNDVIEKIKFCVNYKKSNNLKLTIGLQMVLTPNNVDQVISLAKLGSNLGVDYLVTKQCSDTVDNDLGIYKSLGEYNSFKDILAHAESFSNDSYRVIVKWDKISNKGTRNYDSCLGMPFLLYSSGDGKLYPCGAMFGNDEYLLGDLVSQSFIDIINSKRYKIILDKVEKIDVHKDCYSNCRTHHINEFAWMLKHPPEHVNFV